jgi:glucose-6-phosphate-specific signal transduction histidine kinase
MTQRVPSLSRSVATGAIGFALVSLCIFATVAFAERWMYRTLTEPGAYLIWTVLFILLGGAVFGSLVVVRWRLPRFYLLFGLAFFAYAAGWVIAYFTLRDTAGEVVGSLAGSVLMAIVIARGFGSLRSIVKLSAVLFVSNFLGYFLGAAIFDSLRSQMGMLLFGVVYGLFFGAGIGAVLQMVQQEQQNELG